MTHDEIGQLLRQGIAAAKAGQTAKARALLTRVTELDADNTYAWLWLSSVVESFDERMACLERALVLNPDNAQIKQALHTARIRQARQWTEAGIAAAEAGDEARARTLLIKAVEYDEQSIAAWWWLGQVVESSEEKEVCFENVLTLDPTHVEARAMLEGIQQGRTLVAAIPDTIITFEEPSDYLYVPVSEESTPAEYNASPDRAGAALQSDIVYQDIASSAAEPTSSATIFDDEMSCPYCASPTVFEDRRCPMCNNKLWIKVRPVEVLTRSYWLLIALEAIFALTSVLLPLLLLDYVAFQLDAYDVEQLFQIYLGRLPVETRQIFDLVSPTLFVLSLLPGGLAILILFGVLSRWQPLFFVVFGFEGLRLLGSLGSLFLMLAGELGALPCATGECTEGALAGVGLRYMRYAVVGSELVVLVLTGVSISFLMKVMDHFVIEDRRILLRMDRDLEPEELSFRLRGASYARQKMWALAALHLRRALIFDQHLETYAQLALAYVNLGHYELAETALTDAQRLSPGNAQLEQLRKLLVEKQQVEK